MMTTEVASLRGRRPRAAEANSIGKSHTIEARGSFANAVAALFTFQEWPAAAAAAAR